MAAGQGLAHGIEQGLDSELCIAVRELSKTFSQRLDEVRARLDALDRYVVALIAERRRLVAAAFAAKGDAPKVDPEREAAMIAARRGWANEEGLDADRAEALFRDILSMSRPATVIP